ncbi:MAG: aminotransferase class V-fold PLP-dependent enzyme [Desulfuromonadales bacterium]|jgi:cysteine desulfurase/selenocysteine lyase
MPQAFNVKRARRETRGCKDRIHFNNAGASLPSSIVCNTLYTYLRDEEEQGGYEVMAQRTKEIENFYSASARLLNCSTDEIAFSDSATRAWNTAFYSLDLKRGDRVLASCSEYGSSLVAMLHRARRDGIEIVWVPDDTFGQIDIAALEQLIDDRVKLICLTLVPSGSGLVNPAAAVGRIAHNADIPYLLDACQALGQLPVDVEQLGCDMLCGTGRKFLRGPRGTGLLYVRKSRLETLEPNQLNHHGADLLTCDNYELKTNARRFEFWERSYAGQVALGVAIDYALEWGLENISQRIKLLADQMRKELISIDGLSLIDPGGEQSGIISFCTIQQSAETLQKKLAHRHINTTTVPFSANPVRIDKCHQPMSLRASLHYYNTHDEISQFIGELKQLL